MKKRLLTAAVLIGTIVVVLRWAPAWLFSLLVVLLIAGALHEYLRLVLRNDLFSHLTGMAFGLIFATLLIFVPNKSLLVPVFVFAFFVLVILHMIYFTTAEGVVERLGLVLLGVVYLCFTLPAFAWLRAGGHGRSLVIFAIAIPALGDTFAYGVGKAFGKRKLSPLISPKKTVEGLIASIFGGVAAAGLCWQVFWNELPIRIVLFLGIGGALVGAMGDLVESLIKRAFHVKDSGGLLPGHGGVLDRIDALVFTAPFIYFSLYWTGWI